MDISGEYLKQLKEIDARIEKLEALGNKSIKDRDSHIKRIKFLKWQRDNLANSLLEMKGTKW